MLKWLQSTSQTPVASAERTIIRHAFNQNKLASIVGSLAFLLPIVLAIYGVVGDQFHDTISHFYYSDAFAEEFFVGTLVGVGLIMLAYEGNDGVEAFWATLAGILAILVAFFPADGWIVLRDFGITTVDNVPYHADYPVNLNPSAQVRPIDNAAGIVHKLSAITLFSILAFFCLKIFTRGRFEGQDAELSKQRRNVIYRLCGLVIALAVAVILIGNTANHYGAISGWDRYNLTFWAEAVALIAFGISWITRSRVFGLALLDSDQKAALELERSLR